MIARHDGLNESFAPRRGLSESPSDSDGLPNRTRARVSRAVAGDCETASVARAARPRDGEVLHRLEEVLAREPVLLQALDRELDPQVLSSLCCAAKAIADEVIQAEATSRGLEPANLASYNSLSTRSSIIDGRELTQHKIRVLSSSRAAQLLHK
mgnify:CR=1 FL=1